MDATNSSARHAVGVNMSATDRELDRLRHDLMEFERRFDLMLEAKLQRFRAELLSGFGTMLFISQAVVIAALSMIIALD